MSYRSDLDAAIARVDALSHELALSQAECDRLRAAAARRDGDHDPERLGELERLRATAVAERDRLRAELQRLGGAGPTAPPMVPKVVIGLVIGAILAVMRIGDRGHRDRFAPTPTPTAAPAPIAAPLLPPPRPPQPLADPAAPMLDLEADLVVACAAQLRRTSADFMALKDLRELKTPCGANLQAFHDGGRLTAEASDLLARWTAVDDRMAPSLAAYNTYVLRDPRSASRQAPAELARELEHAVRDRDAILAAVPAALRH